MGAKITIDSATLANKGLEVVEAHWLYDVGYDAIEVVIHPQSVVHSAVQFVDGSLKAQLGTPDMRIPIQYALTFPDRRPRLPRPSTSCGAARLDFFAPDEARFPALRIAREAGRHGPARDGRPDRGRRGGGAAVPRRQPRLPRHRRRPRRRRGSVRRGVGGESPAPASTRSQSLDAEVRAHSSRPAGSESQLMAAVQSLITIVIFLLILGVARGHP